jgi:integrase
MGLAIRVSATSLYFDREAGVERRHHLHESVIQKVMKEAVRAANITKPATPHSLRHYVPFLTMSRTLDKTGINAVNG